MDSPSAKLKFDDRLQEAIDWAIDDGLTVEEMQQCLREIIGNMERYPEEFRPVS